MDDWVHVEGEIVGWLDRENGDGEHTVAVVRVYASSGGWRDEISPLPAFLLRWVNNDCSITDAESGEELMSDALAGNLTGAKITFSTCRREQEDYAN